VIGGELGMETFEVKHASARQNAVSPLAIHEELTHSTDGVCKIHSLSLFFDDHTEKSEKNRGILFSENGKCSSFFYPPHTSLSSQNNKKKQIA
jgi:hypothetical protein